MEEEDTILDMYEPYLMQCGFIERTPKGRVASRLDVESKHVVHTRPLSRVLGGRPRRLPCGRCWL